MNENENIPQIAQSKIDQIEVPNAIEKVIIDFNELKPNSVVIIKISPEGMQQRMAASQQIAMALKPILPLTKEKNICFIIMGNGETMESLEEEQMNAIGWHKKEESRIILPH